MSAAAVRNEVFRKLEMLPAADWGRVNAFIDSVIERGNADRSALGENSERAVITMSLLGSIPDTVSEQEARDMRAAAI